MTTVLETCRIPPPPEAAAELTLPLTFLDIPWLHFHPIRRLLFYNHPCSDVEFSNTIVPKLKQSLSLTLKHYLPVAGNLLYPSNSDHKPVIRYVAGDSVPVTIAVSSRDFDHLTGNHGRDCDQFYDFVPQLPPAVHEHEHDHEHEIVPVLALQVTLFPARGLCIGLTNHHSLGDASSIVGFMWAWAAINKLGGDEEFLNQNSDSLPIFSRSAINDPRGIDTIFWKVMSKLPLAPESFTLPTNRVRATFTLSRTDITKLKNRVLSTKPDLIHVSSFVATTSYVWSCLVKSGDAVGEEVDGEVPEIFIFAVDARGRMDPPVPANYFGNCLGFGMAVIEHGKLVGEEGFVTAAEAVALDIKNRVNCKNELLKGAEDWMSDLQQLVGMREFAISGSPKFDLSVADFGWGKARKMEVVSIDGESSSVSLCNSRDSDGGLEVGLSLPEERMEAFAAIFAGGLSSYEIARSEERVRHSK